MDFFEVMRVLRDVQFAGSICPDHMPRHSRTIRAAVVRVRLWLYQGTDSGG